MLPTRRASGPARRACGPTRRASGPTRRACGPTRACGLLHHSPLHSPQRLLRFLASREQLTEQIHGYASKQPQATTSNHKRRATPLKQPQTTTSGGQLRSIIKQPQATPSCFTSKRRATPLNDTKHSGDDLRSQRKCIADVLERSRRQLRDVGGFRQASHALRQHVADLARSHNSAQRQ